MKSRRPCILMIALIATLPLFGGCGAFRGLTAGLAELVQLQRQLQQQTGQTDLNVNLTNDRYLSIILINSPLAKLPADQKKTEALEVARLAYRDWAKRADLSSVSVIFQTNYNFVFVHFSNSTDGFQFGIPELAQESPASSKEPNSATH